MNSCVYSGSFDPITKGHLDIIKRANEIFPKVYVAVLNNMQKRYMFDMDMRIRMVEKTVAALPGVEVVSSDGLLVDLLEKLGTKVIVRGLRTGADLELEQQLAVVNNQLLSGVETVVLLSRPQTQYVNSSIVRELITYHADITQYVPEEILHMLNGGEGV
ncbi:MAG: pantetheine-phosphate adenylyltransferase [Christensenellaceae bacterium]|jgi:pantetheine-phosphate adenylyltransferase